MCGHTRRDRLNDEDICDNVKMTLIEDKMWQSRLR